MSEKKKSDVLADALAALAAGQHQEEEPQGSGIDAHADLAAAPELSATAPPPPAAAPRAGGPPTPVPRSTIPIPRKPAPPASAQVEPTPAAPRPAGTAPAQSAASNPPRPQATPPRAGAAAPMRPASPNSRVRPSAPSQIPVPRTQDISTPPVAAPPPPVEPPPPPLPPAEPELTPEELAAAHEAEVAAEAEAVARVVEDDDTLNLPSLPTETLMAKRRPSPQRQLASRTVHFKQTLIPILLTMGILLPALALWSMILGDESPIASDRWIALALLGMGIVMLLFGVMTMLQVRAQLAHEAGQ